MLWPASGVLAPGSRFLVQQKDGSLKPASYDHRTFYQGRQEGDVCKHSNVHVGFEVFREFKDLCYVASVQRS